MKAAVGRYINDAPRNQFDNCIDLEWCDVQKSAMSRLAEFCLLVLTVAKGDDKKKGKHVQNSITHFHRAEDPIWLLS